MGCVFQFPRARSIQKSSEQIDCQVLYITTAAVIQHSRVSCTVLLESMAVTTALGAAVRRPHMLAGGAVKSMQMVNHAQIRSIESHDPVHNDMASLLTPRQLTRLS